MDLPERHAPCLFLLDINDNKKIHLDRGDWDPFPGNLDLCRVVGGSIEVLGNDPVTGCRNKINIFYFQWAGAETVEFREDGTQFLFI